jgi:SagB-type dehydrogenase family enzyme
MSRSRSPRTRSIRYRRSPHLVVHWREEKLIVESYAGEVAREIEATPLVLDVLDRFTTWEPIDTVAGQLPKVPRRLLETLIEALAEHGALDKEPTRGRSAKPNPWDEWKAWSPAASFFHQSTKDVAFTARAETNQRLKARAVSDPIPRPLKPPYKGKRIALPPPVSSPDAFPEVLRARRTWRRFGTRPLRIEELSTLLGLTWGVQAWMDVAGWGRMALKTAPSGGARHSIEAYVLVRRVSGLAAGLYHYQPGSHELHAIRTFTPRAGRTAILAYLPRQTFYGNASALILMTSVFARVQWRYAFARAYRTILAEAGHHAQTFCLSATWLGLAPFCTMALADSRIEHDLRIDGVSESVIYAAGVGPRPRDTSWAPWPSTTATPARTPNQLGGPRPRRQRRSR